MKPVFILSIILFVIELLLPGKPGQVGCGTDDPAGPREQVCWTLEPLAAPDATIHAPCESGEPQPADGDRIDSFTPEEEEDSTELRDFGFDLLAPPFSDSLRAQGPGLGLSHPGTLSLGSPGASRLRC